MDFKEFSNEIIKINKDLFGGEGNNLGALVRANIEDGQKSILVLNINPSNADENKKNGIERPSCVPHPLVYIPEIENNIQLIDEFSNKSLIWQSFYSKAYKLVADKVKMFWATGDYKTEILKGYPEYKQQWKACFEEEAEKKKDFIFVCADLFYHCNKNQKEVEKILKSKETKGKVKNIIGIYVKYYKPKLILVTNATASRLVFGGDLTTDEFTIPETEIKCLFSSMLSGSGAIDMGSYYRLKRRIDDLLCH